MEAGAAEFVANVRLESLIYRFFLASHRRALYADLLEVSPYLVRYGIGRMTTVDPRSFWRFTACTLGIGLIASAVASSAQASCGDYVMIGGHGDHAGMSAHGPNHATPSATPSSTDASRRPCSGPECSRRSPQPERLPLSLTSGPAPQWGLSATRVPLARPPASGDASIEKPLHELLHSGSIFRPPRLA